jgi:hypothetical protein
MRGQETHVGVVISLILIAVGAILTWAVHSHSSGIDVNTVGVILMIVGFVLFLLSLLFWRTWWGAGFWGAHPGGPGAGPGYYDDAPVVRRRYYPRRRTAYVEEEPPPGPPPA